MNLAMSLQRVLLIAMIMIFKKNILDLSQKLENGPNQPDFTFPRRNIGGKQRSFNNS